MIHFNRKTEYALMAIEHMIQKQGSETVLSSVREISEQHKIPYPLLAKVMQQLSVKGMIKSVQGTKGGYILAKNPDDMSVASVVEIFEGPFAVAECFNGEKITCPQWDGCSIRSPFSELNNKIFHLLSETSVADLVGGKNGVKQAV